MAPEQTDGLDDELAELGNLENSHRKIHSSLGKAQDTIGKAQDALQEVQNALQEKKDAFHVSKDADGAAAPTEHGNGTENRKTALALHRGIILLAEQEVKKIIDVVNDHPYEHKTPATPDPSVGFDLPSESIGLWHQLHLELKRLRDEYEGFLFSEQEEKRIWQGAKNKIAALLRPAVRATVPDHPCLEHLAVVEEFLWTDEQERILEEIENAPERDVVREYLEEMIGCDLSDFDDWSDWSDEGDEGDEGDEDIDTAVGADDSDP